MASPLIYILFNFLSVSSCIIKDIKICLCKSMIDVSQSANSLVTTWLTITNVFAIITFFLNDGERFSGHELKRKRSPSSLLLESGNVIYVCNNEWTYYCCSIPNVNVTVLYSIQILRFTTLPSSGQISKQNLLCAWPVRARNWLGKILRVIFDTRHNGNISNGYCTDFFK